MNFYWEIVMNNLVCCEINLFLKNVLKNSAKIK